MLNKLLPGDIFCTYNPNFLGKTIKFVQNFGLLNNSEYSHSGIVLDKKGNTFEARKKIGQYNLSDHKGKYLLVGRHRDMTPFLFNKGWDKIQQYEGDVYPYHRMAFFLFPPISKYIGFLDWGVCSEMSCKFLYYCDLLDFGRGVMPSYLGTMMAKWRDFRVVYKGKI